MPEYEIEQITNNWLKGGLGCYHSYIVHGPASFHKCWEHIPIDADYLLLNTIPESHLLGLLKLPSLKVIKFIPIVPDILSIVDKAGEQRDQFDLAREAIEIIKNHLEDRDILQCQEDLIEAGLEEYARL